MRNRCATTAAQVANTYSFILRRRGGGVDHPELGHGPPEVGAGPEDECLPLRETRCADLHVHQRIGEQDRRGSGCNEKDTVVNKSEKTARSISLVGAATKSRKTI